MFNLENGMHTCTWSWLVVGLWFTLLPVFVQGCFNSCLGSFSAGSWIFTHTYAHAHACTHEHKVQFVKEKKDKTKEDIP